MKTSHYLLITVLALACAMPYAWAQEEPGANPPPPPGGRLMGGHGPFMMSIEMFDANNDGTVTEEEFTAAWEKRNKEKFKRLDTDNDRRLSKDELANDKGHGPRGGPGGKGGAMRGEGDDARRPPMPPSGNHRRGDGHPPFYPSAEDLDANKDGSVTWDEYSSAWHAINWTRFKQMDENNDNVLTSDELAKRQGPPPPPPPPPGTIPPDQPPTQR